MSESEAPVKTEQEIHTNPMLAMAVEKDFPEFVFAFAEENFLRGYQLGLDDVRLLKRSPEAVEE